MGFEPTTFVSGTGNDALTNCATTPFGGGDGIRTHTLLILSQLPLPLGYTALKMAAPGGIEPPHAVPKTAALPLCEGAVLSCFNF